MRKNTFSYVAFLHVVLLGIMFTVSTANAVRRAELRFNIKLNAIQYAEKDKAFKLAKELLQHAKWNQDLEQVALLMLAKPGTEERTKKVLLDIYNKQAKLGKREKNRKEDLLKVANTSGQSKVIITAVSKLGLDAYPAMVKALKCKQRRSRRRKKNSDKLAINQQSLAEAITILVTKHQQHKTIKRSLSKIVRCYSCAPENTALACGRSIAALQKLDNRTLNGVRSVMIRNKSIKRKKLAAKLLSRNAGSDKRYKRALEAGVRSRNEATRLTAAIALYKKMRNHHGAKKALERLGKSARDKSNREKATQALNAAQ